MPLIRGIILIFFLAIFGRVQATHLMGGEITWKCLGSGQYVFSMKIYKDCNGAYPVQAPGISFNLDVMNHPTVSSINMFIMDSIDITPTCNVAGPVYSCSGVLGPGAHMEFNFRSNPVSLPGVPPAAGWIFSWGDNCCRNTCIDNLISPDTYGITLRAIMYPYNNMSANPCFDSSPTFAQRPTVVLCGGNPMVYNHNAFDPDLDSLVYSWGNPLQHYTGSFSTATNCPFNGAQGYSATSPFPGPTLNPSNVPASLNTNTGQISFTSYTYGCFVTVIKVSSYKCGVKVAEIFRDIQVMILNCGANVPPTVSAPFNGGTSYDTTLLAGGVVDFWFSAIDSGWDPSWAFNQWITFTASGAQFDSNFVNTTTGCLNPPCATLTPYPFPIQQIKDSVHFHWETTCDHINYGNQGGGPCSTPVMSNKYAFVITSKDDYCPAPGFVISTINITVLALPVSGTPSLRCVNVLPNGDTELSWDPPDDPGGTFADYYILTSTSAGGPFTPLDSSINVLATGFYTHVGAGANTTPRYYIIRSRSGCFGKVQSTPSDTLQAIVVDVVNPGTGFAEVSWNPLKSPLPSTSLGWYRIYRKVNSVGAWTLIDSTQSTNYSDPAFLCNDTLYYRVEIDDSLFCTSRSTEDSEVFFDNVAPAIPVIDSVSIDLVTGQVVIGWAPDSSIDTRGYILYHVQNGANIYMDTVYGINNTFYAAGFSPGCPDTVRIVAYDSCNNQSPFGLRHRTLCLDAALNPCLQGAELSWTGYVNWPSGVSGYEIYYSENGGPYFLAGNTDGSTTDFFHSPINPNSIYNYFVRARSGTMEQSSTSNIATLVAAVIKLPEYLYVRTATVSGERQVRVDLFTDSLADVASYKIMRAVDTLSTFDTLATLVANPSTGFYSFLDTTANPSDTSYFYKAGAVDICDVVHLSDNYGRTILLLAEPNEDLTNTLYFNDYADWSGGVDKYHLFRNVSGIWEDQPVTEIPFGQGTFVDDISAFITSDGQFCYYLRALEGPGNLYGFSDTSLSNVACVVQGPRLYTPNAFTPEGKNPVFYPVNAFIDISSFDFKIFNRWGREIYASKDPKAGWDGFVGSEAAPPGVYVYLLKLTGTNGKEIQRKGTITLIR